MFKISQSCFAGRPRGQINSSRQSESSEFLPTTFAVIFSAVALPVVPKVEFTFEAIMYITIFVFWSPESCFKSVICIQNLLTWKRCTDRHVFAAVERRKNSSPERFEDTVLLDPLFWGHLNINRVYRNPLPREKEHFFFARLSFSEYLSYTNAIQHISTSPRKLIDACHFQPMGFRFAQAK